MLVCDVFDRTNILYMYTYISKKSSGMWCQPMSVYKYYSMTRTNTRPLFPESTDTIESLFSKCIWGTFPPRFNSIAALQKLLPFPGYVENNGLVKAPLCLLLRESRGMGIIRTCTFFKSRRREDCDISLTLERLKKEFVQLHRYYLKI